MPSGRRIGSGVNAQTYPPVTKQYDNEIPKDKQIKEFFELVDGKSIGLLGTYRNGVGPVGRSMAIAKCTGPDFIFLTNTNFRKFSDLKSNPEVQITFQDMKIWIGDLGDAKHDGSAQDPRKALIEVKSKFITYWLHRVETLGFGKEVGVALLQERWRIRGF
ncbi:hypothetical protein K469DRAFT_724158 [Zopfia rhizophila CBS 207.26]|uniref:Uncharacterized protein n=1 Tax=Zopfia rhizophila CBS 207.26 TaxID=1314779 RepID=A0A6A6DCM2_9PEZI|nr:hypothetical protein K469DRAFT_724158 [Zopfia rhizophila CBS 207.26]